MCSILGFYLCVSRRYNLSEEARATTRHGFQALSFFAETAVYVYLGMNFSFSFTSVTPSLQWNARFLAVVLVLAVVSRAVAILVCSAAFNLCSHKRRRISLRMQLAVWLSGGLRGCIAFALAL